mmetsp:Transcript_49286/g.86770  ORF Transcript_49286/g.86770 Transcript_49286/m.86770 type:complete len:135 (+) Transcript_49286:68-472(+)
MGLPSIGQLRAQKAASKKGGKRSRHLTKKSLKNQSQQERRRRKLEKERDVEEQRGRASMGEAGTRGTSSTTAPRSTSPRDETMRSKSVPLVPGTGSGTPGARAASAKLKPAVRMSKRGGRRRKPTWRAFGKGSC